MSRPPYLTPLRHTIEQLTRQMGSRWRENFGFILIGIDTETDKAKTDEGTDEGIVINGERLFYAASLIKLPILYEALRQIRQYR